ncbi:MAG: tetratricopeptide repeat protein [Lachnospiraceae bacterium]|nr:tetratricopeptide repeat protein [Lachnospiraceae bacterium]
MKGKKRIESTVTLRPAAGCATDGEKRLAFGRCFRRVGCAFGRHFRRIGCALVMLCVVLATGCAMGEATGENTTAGLEALEEGDYQGALTLFEQAVADGEQQVLAYRGLGLACMGLGDYEGAVDAFEAALANTDSRMPSNTEDIRLYLATAQYRLQDYTDVIDTCTDILTASEDGNADAYFLRGASYLQEGETDKAASDFDAAVALEAEDYDLYLNIYECYVQANLSAVGVVYLQTAQNLKGDDTEYYYNQGRIYYYLGNYTEAQRMLITPVEEKYEPAMYLIGKVYLAMDDYTHALAVYQQIQDEFGESAECYNGLAICAIQQGNYDTALTYISLGLALDGTSGKQELYFNEIVAYERKLDFATAKEKAEAYVANYPTDEAGQKEWAFLSTRQ